MKILICYDVCTTDETGPRRLRHIARACLDYGQRVQKSVFECTLSPVDWVALHRNLESIMDQEVDSLRFYLLHEDIKIVHLGANSPADLDGPLVI